MAPAALEGDRTITQFSDKYGVRVSQITAWKEQLEASIAYVIGPGGGSASAAPSVDIKAQHAEIGGLSLETAFLWARPAGRDC